MQIDKGILPIVEAMNATNFMETCSSCQGHSKGIHRLPYVAFYCRQNEVRKLSVILDNAGRELDGIGAPFFIDCCLVFDSDIGDNTVDAKLGWAVFNIRPIECKGFRMKKTDKEIFVLVIANAILESN